MLSKCEPVQRGSDVRGVPNIERYVTYKSETLLV